MASFLASLPNPVLPQFDEYRALALVALPLSCIDRPQSKQVPGGYLYIDRDTTQLIEDYERNRAFYGCYDWHSAVHAIWTMIVILRRFPSIPIAGLIREKINHHLAEQAINGEVDFFRTAGTFELPYGRCWLLKLFAELQGSDDEDAQRWTGNLSPLAVAFAADALNYVTGLEVANRTGLHGNSAYSMSLALDYADAVNNLELRRAIENAADRLFTADKACITASEPLARDFLSPCLEEARLMSRVLENDRFVSWFEAFMSAPDAEDFRPLASPVNTTTMDQPEQLATKSHLIGLSFSRAESILRIAESLPQDNLRRPVYRRLARIHAAHAWDNIFSADYLGSHWLATFALRYEIAYSEFLSSYGST